MTQETAYSKVPPDLESNSETPEPAPEPQLVPIPKPTKLSTKIFFGFVILMLGVILGLSTWGIYTSVCDPAPLHTHAKCGVMNTSTSEVFRCHTNGGHYTCTKPLEPNTYCNSLVYQSSWGECTYVAGTVSEPWIDDPYNAKNTTATCFYTEVACKDKPTSLVNMKCCQFRNLNRRD